MPHRHLPAAMAFALSLAGCGPAREDQTPEQVQAELAKAVMPKPGLWAMHYEVMSFAAPGMPDAAVESARREVAARGRLGQLKCVTEATLAAARSGEVLGKSDMFCPPIYFKNDGAAYDSVWLCRSRYDDATVEARGTATAERDVSTIQVNSSIPGSPAGRYTMELVLTTERQGDCPAG